MSALGKSALSIQPGERVVEDGKTYRITKHVSADAVLATDIETHRTKVLRVESIAPAPDPDDGNERPGQPALDGYPDEVWALAQRRLAIIKPLLENPQRTRSVMVATAKHHGVGVTTLYRWLNAYESAEQLVALIPEKRGRPKGLRFLTEEQEAIIEVAIKERYLNKRRATEKEVIEYVEQMCRKARVQPPNHNSVRARIHDVPKATALRKRGRPDLARGRYQPLKGSFTGADYPLAVAQIDHTPGDIILVDEVSRKPIGRPWVTLAIDVYSRVVLGLHVSLDNPSFRSVGMCLAQAICSKARYLASLKIEGEWPVWGFMSSIHADNAKEFRGKGLTRACENYGIDLQWRPVGLPEYGGHIERLMGTVGKEFAKIPGKTFANTADRKGYDAEGAAIMTLRKFEAYFVDLIVNKYHKTLHSQLGVTPLVQWRRGIEGFGDAPGRGIPPPPADPDRLRLDFLPFIERTIQRYGVQKDHIQYYDPILDPYINSEDEDSSTAKMYTFRYDPSDISRLYFLDPLTNHYVLIPYRNMSHPRISEAERRAAVAELRKQGRSEIDEDALFATADRLRARIDEAAASTKAARRAQAKRPPKQPPPPTGSDIDFDAPLPIADPTKPRKALSEPDALRGLFDEPVKPLTWIESMKFPHLTPEAAAMLEAPKEERIEFYKEDRWVAYPTARDFIKLLDDLYLHPRTLRMPNYLLVGRSGNGKSTILEHFVRRYSPTVDDGGFPVMPVLRVEVPPDPTESSFYSAMLWRMMKGHREKDSVSAKRQQAIALLRQLQVRILMLDEFSNIAEAGRATRGLLSSVRHIANDAKVAICAAGTQSAINALNQDPQLKSRFQGFPLPAWKLDRSYLQFLAAYEQMLPLAEPSGLATEALAPLLHSLCGEAIGETVKLLKLSAAHAVKTGAERITAESLKQVHWVAPSKWSDVVAVI